MAVYPTCTECNCRRNKCLEPSAHKKAIRWTADVQFTRSSPRMRKTYDTKELADIQYRQWRTDYERGVLLPKAKPTITFGQAADEWWNNEVIGQARIRNPKRSEQSRVKMFRQLFDSITLTELKLSDAEQWLNSRIAAGCAINTINRDMKPLKWIMNYAVKKGYLTVNPFSGLKELKGGNIRVRWMTEAETQILVNTAKTLEDNDLVDMIAIGLNTGFRKGNLERLCARDVSNNRITAARTKSGKPYDVPISPAILSLLSRLVQQHPTGPLLNTIKLDARFRKAARLAGLYENKSSEEKVTVHTLRHTFAALYLKRGGDLYKLSKLLGHSTIRVTEATYAHICPRELDAQASLISTEVDSKIDFKIA